MSAKFNSFSYLHANFRVSDGGVYAGDCGAKGSVVLDSQHSDRASKNLVVTDCDRKHSEDSEHSPYLFGLRGWKLFNDMDV